LLDSLLQEEIGLSKTADELCINLNTLKGWVQLSVHPHICDICEKAFPYKASLKKHLLTHPEYKVMNGISTAVEDVKPNIRYDPSFKHEVAQFALANSIQEATAKYQLAHSTVNYWLKLISDPKPCHLCGKTFANDSTVRRHIEQVHKHTPEGALEQARKLQELSVQPFFQYLADNDLLPSEEMIRAREDEKERREREKSDLAVVAREVIAREQEKEKEKEKELDREMKNIKQEISSEENVVESDNHQVQEAIKFSLKLSFKKDSKEWKLKKDDVNNTELSDELCDRDLTSEDDFEKEYSHSPEIKQEEGFENYDLSIFEPNTCLEMSEPEEPKIEPDVFDPVKMEPDENIHDFEQKNIATETKGTKGSIGKKSRKNKKHQKNLDGSYSCSFCEKTFLNSQRAKYHEQVIHLGEFVTNCEYCGTQFKEGIKLTEHQLRKHPELLEEKLGEPITKYQCELCEKCFNVKRDFDRHMKTTHGPKKLPEYKFICDHCGKRFSRRTYLKSHENKAHGLGEVKVRQFHCPHCPNVYSVKDHLNRHIRVIHENERLQCDLCAKLFSDKSALNRHQLYHGEPQFECFICQTKFREARLLKRHHRLYHEGGERPTFTCVICVKDFISDQSYKNHMQMFHEESDTIIICNICGKEFKNVKLHRVHMRFHEQKRKNLTFTCETCGKEYKSKVSLESHIDTIHKGLRNFDCDICGKLFTRANTLRTHKKIHTGLKPFQCLYCGSGYGEKRNLMNHIGRNHPGSEMRFKKETLEGSFIVDC